LVSVITNEMVGKAIDDSHFKFHITCKVMILNALHKLKKGVDFMKTLSNLNFSTDPKWIKNSCNDPNVKIFLEILEEYKQYEKRPTRAKVLIPLIEYAIGLYASDLFFRERGEWFIYRLFQRSPEMKFFDFFVDPAKWYPHTRDINGHYMALENDPNKPPIEQEYIEWYGIDPTKDLIDIPEELKQRIIKENRDWVERFNPELLGG
jgi:hypothetical protein